MHLYPWQREIEVLSFLLFKNWLSFIYGGLHPSHISSTILTSNLIIQITSALEPWPARQRKKKRKKKMKKKNPNKTQLHITESIVSQERPQYFVACRKQPTWSETMTSEKKSRKPLQRPCWGLSHSPTHATIQTHTQASPTTDVFTLARCWLSCGNGFIY